MANIEKTLVLRREDLRVGSFTKSISEIKYDDFTTDYDKMCKQSFIIFVDDNMETLLLKNRYGYNGLITH